MVSAVKYTLKHPTDGVTIATISNAPPIITFTERSAAIKSALEEGIRIPRNEKNKFENKKIVHLNDTKYLFNAFMTIYFPHTLRESGFKLEEDRRTTRYKDEGP